MYIELFGTAKTIMLISSEAAFIIKSGYYFGILTDIEHFLSIILVLN